MPEREYTCCVSGSYSKAWPEISNTIKEFQELGIKVLEPKGTWILTPTTHILELSDKQRFRPLSNETHLTPEEVEDNFLQAIARSTFLYLDNHFGYLGETAALEVGFALGKRKPVFIRQEVSSLIETHPEMMDYVRVALPSEVKSLLNSGE